MDIIPLDTLVSVHTIYLFHHCLIKTVCMDVGVLSILRAVQTEAQVQAVSSVSALTASAPPYPTMTKLSLAECGCGSLDVLDEAAHIFTGNK